MRSSLRYFVYRPVLLFSALRLCAILGALSIGLASSAYGQFRELIVDGDFEGANTNWLIGHDVNPAPTTRGWFITPVGDATPFNGLPTTTEGGGENIYVLSDQQTAGTMALVQQFAVPTDMPLAHLLLSFDLFVNDWSSQSVLDPFQNGRVDITTLTTAVGIPNQVDNGVLFNAYVGTDGGPLPNEFRHYEFDILPFVTPGNSYRLRIQATGHRGVLNLGIDNISVLAVPEPSTLALGAMALAMSCAAPMRRWRRRRRVGCNRSECPNDARGRTIDCAATES